MCNLYSMTKTKDAMRQSGLAFGGAHDSPKAMPVILTELDELETCLTQPWGRAGVLQRPAAGRRP